jgi:hypothetical protein
MTSVGPVYKQQEPSSRYCVAHDNLCNVRRYCKLLMLQHKHLDANARSSHHSLKVHSLFWVRPYWSFGCHSMHVQGRPYTVKYTPQACWTTPEAAVDVCTGSSQHDNPTKILCSLFPSKCFSGDCSEHCLIVQAFFGMCHLMAVQRSQSYSTLVTENILHFIMAAGSQAVLYHGHMAMLSYFESSTLAVRCNSAMARRSICRGFPEVVSQLFWEDPELSKLACFALS